MTFPDKMLSVEGEGFTPGPWVLEDVGDGHVIRMGEAIVDRGCHDSDLRIDYAHGLDREDSDDPCYQKQCDRAEATARLITAAPDLYEALRNLLAVIVRNTAEPKQGAKPGSVVANARAALRRATGDAK